MQQLFQRISSNCSFSETTVAGRNKDKYISRYTQYNNTVSSNTTPLDKVTYSGVCPNSLESLSEDGRGAGGGEEFTAH